MERQPVFWQYMDFHNIQRGSMEVEKDRDLIDRTARKGGKSVAVDLMPGFVLKGGFP